MRNSLGTRCSFSSSCLFFSFFCSVAEKPKGKDKKLLFSEKRDKHQMGSYCLHDSFQRYDKGSSEKREDIWEYVIMILAAQRNEDFHQMAELIRQKVLENKVSFPLSFQMLGSHISFSVGQRRYHSRRIQCAFFSHSQRQPRPSGWQQV